MYPSKMIGNKTWQLTSHFDIILLLYTFHKLDGYYDATANPLCSFPLDPELRPCCSAALKDLKVGFFKSISAKDQKENSKLLRCSVLQASCSCMVFKSIFRSYSVVIDARKLTLCRYIATTFTTFKRSFEHLYIWLSIRIATLPRVNPVLSTLWQFFLKKPTLLPKSGAAPH